MTIELSNHALTLLVEKAAELGARRALTQTGLIRPYLSKAEAYREYGYTKVDRWIEQGLITPRKDGNYSANWRIDRLEIEALQIASELIIYL